MLSRLANDKRRQCRGSCQYARLSISAGERDARERAFAFYVLVASLACRRPVSTLAARLLEGFGSTTRTVSASMISS